MLSLVEQRRSELERLCQRYHVGRLELFGSAATGNFNPTASDLDFLVDFLPLPPIERADAYFGLLHGLEDLFRRKIDLVTVQAAENRWFLRTIDPERRVLYAA
jgi:predicted nucleotidyltransferase